eukprot:scaffold26088_cov132-Cylindrotheca_fusiformis.AAC.6
MIASNRDHEEGRSSVDESSSYPKSKLDVVGMTREDNEEQQASHHTHFPLRLHEMLTWAESQGYDAVVSWLPGNPPNSFKVHRKDDFVHQILPRFFKQTQYKSFIRQLNLWDFERIVTATSDKGGYKHALFSKDNPGLCMEMKRTKIKGKNNRMSQQSKAAVRRKMTTNTDILSDDSSNMMTATSVNSQTMPLAVDERSTDGLALLSNMEKPLHISPHEMKYVRLGMDLGRLMSNKPR